MRLFILMLMLVIGLSSSCLHAYTISSFDHADFFVSGGAPTAQQVANLDTAIGMTNALVEDFEDTSLVDGLSVSFAACCSQTSVQTSLSSGVLDATSIGSWDGSQAFLTGIANIDTVFSYAPGTSSFGVGMGDIESAMGLMVNGTLISSDLRTLANRNRGLDNAREVYLRIDAAPGDDPITEVRFLASGNGDGIFWDHLTLSTASPVPEPSTWLLGLLALAGMSFRTGKK